MQKIIKIIIKTINIRVKVINPEFVNKLLGELKALFAHAVTFKFEPFFSLSILSNKSSFLVS